jgi:hypothetical protein
MAHSGFVRPTFSVTEYLEVHDHGDVKLLRRGCAFLRLVAAAQVYADGLYGLFHVGCPKSKQDEVMSRKAAECATVYFTIAISAAGLFGVYELMVQ